MIKNTFLYGTIFCSVVGCTNGNHINGMQNEPTETDKLTKAACNDICGYFTRNKEHFSKKSSYIDWQEERDKFLSYYDDIDSFTADNIKYMCRKLDESLF